MAIFKYLGGKIIRKFQIRSDVDFLGTETSFCLWLWW